MHKASELIPMRTITTMRRFLEKCGFKFCGIIYLEDGSEESWLSKS
jgi:hypothetical protein